MQMEKALINDRLNISKVSREFCIPTIYNFAIIYPWNLLFSSKVSYFLAVSTVVYKKKTLQLNNLKTRAAMNAEISVFVICVEAIIYFILYNLHHCPFKAQCNGCLADIQNIRGSRYTDNAIEMKCFTGLC